MVPPGLGPLLVERVREQVTRVPRAASSHAAPSRERSAASARRSNPPTSVSTSQPGNRSTRPPLNTTASSRPRACRAWCAALRRLAAPASGSRCGHSASMTCSRMQPVTIGQGQQLNQLRGPATRPRGVRDLRPADRDRETPEQLDPHLPAPYPRRHASPSQRPYQAREAYPREPDLTPPAESVGAPVGFRSPPEPVTCDDLHSTHQA